MSAISSKAGKTMGADLESNLKALSVFSFSFPSSVLLYSNVLPKPIKVLALEAAFYNSPHSHSKPDGLLEPDSRPHGMNTHAQEAVRRTRCPLLCAGLLSGRY